MIAVIFEVEPHPDHLDRYLEIAAGLREDLMQIDGFISVERFSSLTTPGKLLSLSFFRDEAAVHEWRRLEKHRDAQRMGRGGLFTDYRLRVARVMRDYTLTDRAEAPEDSRAAHDLG